MAIEQLDCLCEIAKEAIEDDKKTMPHHIGPEGPIALVDADILLELVASYRKTHFQEDT